MEAARRQPGDGAADVPAIDDQVGQRSRWNHNIHYHPVILQAVPDGCQQALDVGCGEGTLTRQLRELVPHVTGIDLDRTSIDHARKQDPNGRITYLLGDVLTHDFEPNAFDLVTAVATLHHMDATTALNRMAMLLRPGGTLAIIGLARGQLPASLPLDLAATIASRAYRLGKTHWQHPSPMVWPPPVTFGQMRRVARRQLPGVRYRRHLLWRYSLVWRKHGP
ncbi:class I SAM-dependent methyltransferase [Planosporangium thailandense]|uniref:Class I SAM-dependent methyltransferase n=2 Tax=Planosporangium thailandense TaxID=765197 RepID=A0ABX0XWM7_9ACTN|nr:class I SAM-dependent methyltransferase [Planosporangium thailandense]